MDVEQDTFPARKAALFNGPVEMSLHVLLMLHEAFPLHLTIDELNVVEYLSLHSGDIDGGPTSLHPPSPFRAGELLVRRQYLVTGVSLLLSRHLIESHLTQDRGTVLGLSETAGSFLSVIESDYSRSFLERARWTLREIGAPAAGELARSLIENVGHEVDALIGASFSELEDE